MTLDDFHHLVGDAMNLQRGCAEHDGRDRDSLEGWLKELCDLIHGEDEEEG